MALILDAMAERDLPVSALAAELPHYEIVKTKFTVSAEAALRVLAGLAERFPEATADRLDGLRLDWPDKWLLVRTSNTEPIVRAIAERRPGGDLCDKRQVLAAV
jgi:phosphomannomutase